MNERRGGDFRRERPSFGCGAEELDLTRVIARENSNAVPLAGTPSLRKDQTRGRSKGSAR